MRFVNRTVRMDARWTGRAIAASLIAGAAGYLPIFLYPRDVFYGWVEELLPILACAVPSFIGAFWGRFWLPNLVAASLFVVFTFEAGYWQGSFACLSCGVMAAATMSYLAGRWHLVDGQPRTRLPDSQAAE